MKNHGILPEGFSVNKKYNILLFIKKGNNAETYRVKGNDGKFYFLKIFNYSRLHRSAFDKDNNLLEIELLKKINDEHLVHFKDSGELIFENKKLVYLVLDFIPGETLSERISREPIATLYDVKQIAIDILKGIDYLHNLPEPVIHNEITPQNIMLDLSDNISKAVIIDFGYSRPFYQSTTSYNKEGLNLNYVASECFNNLYSPQSDLFSVGAVMYHLLFGLPPWFTEMSNFQMNRVQTEEWIMKQREKPLLFPNIENNIPDFNDSILKILEKSLQTDVEKRFQSANEFIQALNGELEIEENNPDDNPKEEDLQKPKRKPVGKGKGFSAIAGMKDLKERLQNDVIDLIEHPDEYKKHQLGLPNGMLLYGPPGCGKTFFAEKFSEEAGYNFIKIISSDIASIYVHGTQEKIGGIFKDAKKNAPTILFFDELDAMVPHREKVNNQSASGEVNEFLSQLDNIGNSGVFVIGSTNKPDFIDKAILRAGRLEKRFYIPPPDFEARKAMFELYLKDRPLDFGFDYDLLASLTENYVASDIKFIVDESSRKTIKDKTKRVSMETLKFIINHQKPTVSLSELKKYEQTRQKMDEDFDINSPQNRPRIGFEF